ncbi:MAG: hypothetical protein ABH879_10440 [archaeon]
MADYELEEVADWAIEECRCFIHTESQAIADEHDLYQRLLAWHNVIGHLEERCPEELLELNGKIAEILHELTRLVEEGSLKDLEFRKEEQGLLKQLDDDVKHRDWMAVKRDMASEENEQRGVIRLQDNELEQVHALFMRLLRLMKEGVAHDPSVERAKDEFERAEEYYLLEIYKFARAYERIFRHLWKKERILTRKLKKARRGL